MDIFDHCASQLFQRFALLHSSGLRLCYWILLCASCVYKSKTFWLASNVSLVESESCAPLIPLVGELMDSKVYQQGIFFKCRIFFFRSQTLHAGYPARCRRTLTFTFMHLADAFIQSDLQWMFCHYACSLGIEPTTFCAANAMLYHWATGTL